MIFRTRKPIKEKKIVLTLPNYLYYDLKITKSGFHFAVTKEQLDNLTEFFNMAKEESINYFKKKK